MSSAISNVGELFGPQDWAVNQRNPGRHTTGIVAVIVIHGLALWLILSGLGKAFLPPLPPPVVTLIPQVAEPPRPKPEPLKQSRPDVSSVPQTLVPKSEVDPPAMQDLPTVSDTPPTQSDTAVPSSEPSTGSPVDQAGPRGFGSISNRAACLAAFRDSFPREARRSQLQGSVTISARIGPDGRVLRAEVVASNPRRVFDRAALGVLNSGICQFETDDAEYDWQAEVTYRLQGESAD